MAELQASKRKYIVWGVDGFSYEHYPILSETFETLAAAQLAANSMNRGQVYDAGKIPERYYAGLEPAEDKND